MNTKITTRKNWSGCDKTISRFHISSLLAVASIVLVASFVVVVLFMSKAGLDLAYFGRHVTGTK